MAAAAPGERPDREDLNVTSFKRGEWDALKILQTKLDNSTGLAKGSCAAVLLGPPPDGCPHDKRVGCEGSCGRSHQGPADRKVEFCEDVAKVCGLEGKLYLNNNRFWTGTPPGHQRQQPPPPSTSTAIVVRKGGGSPKRQDDDDDDDP